jgi:hypothetical protein
VFGECLGVFSRAPCPGSVWCSERRGSFRGRILLIICSIHILFRYISTHNKIMIHLMGVHGSIVVKALRYKLEGSGFDTR